MRITTLPAILLIAIALGACMQNKERQAAIDKTMAAHENLNYWQGLLRINRELHSGIVMWALIYEGPEAEYRQYMQLAVSTEYPLLNAKGRDNKFFDADDRKAFETISIRMDSCVALCSKVMSYHISPAELEDKDKYDAFIEANRAALWDNLRPAFLKNDSLIEARISVQKLKAKAALGDLIAISARSNAGKDSPVLEYATALQKKMHLRELDAAISTLMPDLVLYVYSPAAELSAPLTQKAERLPEVITAWKNDCHIPPNDSTLLALEYFESAVHGIPARLNDPSSDSMSLDSEDMDSLFSLAEGHRESREEVVGFVKRVSLDSTNVLNQLLAEEMLSSEAIPAYLECKRRLRDARVESALRVL